MATEEETTPTARALALQMRFSGAPPTLMREYGIRDFRARKPRLSGNPSYRRGYHLARQLSQDFQRFVETIERGTPGVRAGRDCMSFLMQRQYGGNPPDPCPCYTWT
ncbi:MAG: hypothetical protein QG636_637 [Patescibacteria group bacterium]|nr:hypothetical protein [Patescibacteria group bacterium]